MDSANQVVEIQDLAPDLDYGVVPIPYPEGRPELANPAIVRASTLFIPANSEKKEAAWEFMKYLLSPEVMAQFTKAITNLAARTSLIDDPAYDSLPPTYHQFLESLAFKNLVPAAPAVPWQSEWQTQRKTVFDNVNRGVTSPAEAIDALERIAKDIAGGAGN